MNLSFYLALDHLSLGVAVTLEFIGPLALATVASSRRLDLLWAALAGLGVVVLCTGVGANQADFAGVLFALMAGAFWALYILLSARVGRAHPGIGGLAMALCVSAVLLAPIGIAQGGSELIAPSALALGLVVGTLSTAIPYALELESLRRLSGAAFGVLMSLEPAVGAAVGVVLLNQGLAAWEMLGIALVVMASAGILSSPTAQAPPDLA